MIAIAVEAYFKPQRPICPIARLAQQATCFRKPLLTRPEAPVGAVASLPRQTCGHHAPGRGIADGKQPVGDRLPLDDQIEREAYPPVVERRPPGVEHEIIGTAKGRDLGRSRHSAVQPVEPLGREIADDMGLAGAKLAKGALLVACGLPLDGGDRGGDRKSIRLNSSYLCA